MNNKKLYVGLYYFSFLLSIFVCILPNTLQIIFVNSNYFENIYLGLSAIPLVLIVINLILVLIFTIFLIKKKLDDVNILFPIIYITFTMIILLICTLFNSRLVIPFIQFSYYTKFILINYILFNLYSILLFKNK